MPLSVDMINRKTRTPVSINRHLKLREGENFILWDAALSPPLAGKDVRLVGGLFGADVRRQDMGQQRVHDVSTDQISVLPQPRDRPVLLFSLHALDPQKKYV